MLKQIGNTTINITIKKTDKCYDITYDPPIEWLDTDSCTGAIVAINLITDAWVQLMSLDDKELSKYCNLTNVSDYRKQMIRSIGELWD